METKKLENPTKLLAHKRLGRTLEFVKSDKTSKKEFNRALINIVCHWTRIELSESEYDLTEVIKSGGFLQYIKHLEWNKRRQNV